VYFARRRALCEALAGYGVPMEPGDGLNLWLPVHDEQTALVRLAAAGIRAAPGGPFVATPAADDAGGHVRVTVGLVRDEFDAVARVLALAAAP